MRSLSQDGDADSLGDAAETVSSAQTTGFEQWHRRHATVSCFEHCYWVFLVFGGCCNPMRCMQPNGLKIVSLKL